MSFWTQEFMDNRRNQWLNALVKFEYQVGGTWYEAKINSKRITGTKLEIVVSLPRVSTGSQTITAVRIIDVTGKQCGYQATNLKRADNQGVLTKYEFPIYEKGDES